MTPGAQADRTGEGRAPLLRHDRLADAVRVVVAPLVLLFSGFFTADFLLSGVYTWPRTSRVLVLTLTVAILAYEFVYKEQRARHVEASDTRSLKAVLYSCVVPYGVGALALLLLARLAAA
ncbi:MAG: hypothetical protein AB1411_07660 [Nitrospirota bacterium]